MNLLRTFDDLKSASEFGQRMVCLGYWDFQKLKKWNADISGIYSVNSGMLPIICCECKKIKGEKEGLGVTGVSHTWCKECKEKKQSF